MRKAAALGAMLVAAQAAAVHGMAAEAPAQSDTAAIMQAESVIQALEACRERLDPQIDIGFERIAARCPELARRLERNPLAPWLPEGWRDTGNNLSAGSLEELAVLIARESAMQSNRPPPNVEHLRDVLDEIGQASAGRSSLWKRIRLWLEKILPSGEEPADTGWIGRMASRIGPSQTVIELITYAALALVIALGALIVVNELRASGFLRRRRERSANDTPASAVPDEAAVSWRDVERAPIADKPRLLLELLLDRLVRARRLPPARSLTTRELTQAAQLPDATDRARLQALALAAERVRYSAARTAQADIEAALEGGRALLRSLESATDTGAR